MLADHIHQFDDPLLETAIPVINIVGFDSIAANVRLEFTWAIIQVVKRDADHRHQGKLKSLLPYLDTLADIRFLEQLKMYHLVYIADINDFYRSVHDKDLFDRHVLDK